MKPDVHLSDATLLLEIDGELAWHEKARVEAHLDVCWTCRTRRLELESAISGFVHVHQEQFETEAPGGDGRRALLRARLNELAAQQPPSPPKWLSISSALACAVAVLLLLTVWFGYRRSEILHRRNMVVVELPDARLTPGATVLVSRVAVCAEPNTKNKAVPVSLRKKVFDEYGIAGADPRFYEVDYLVTPALGGSDDIHNLWPHSYSATAWNAHVKDELEDHLRDLVCDGSLDLKAAQQEIASNWIETYKKWFRTERPLDH